MSVFPTIKLLFFLLSMPYSLEGNHCVQPTLKECCTFPVPDFLPPVSHLFRISSSAQFQTEGSESICSDTELQTCFPSAFRPFQAWTRRSSSIFEKSYLSIHLPIQQRQPSQSSQESSSLSSLVQHSLNML